MIDTHTSAELAKVLHAMPSEVGIVNKFFAQSLKNKPVSQIIAAEQTEVITSALADQHVRAALDRIGKKLKPHPAGIEPDLPIEFVFAFGLAVAIYGAYLLGVYIMNRP